MVVVAVVEFFDVVPIYGLPIASVVRVVGVGR